MTSSPPSATSGGQPLQLVQMRDLLLSLPAAVPPAKSSQTPTSGDMAVIRKTEDGRSVGLPSDIFFLILTMCDVKTLVTCRLVSKDFDLFIRNQKSLLYKLALNFEHQIDHPRSGKSSSLTSFQRLQRLYRQSLAWRGELPPATKVDIPISILGSCYYELNGGVFALIDDTVAERYPIAFPSIDPSGDYLKGRVLQFIKLPSVISGDLQMEIGHIKLAKMTEILEFTINVELDLLLLVDKKVPATEGESIVYRVHLMSLSSSGADLEPHPLAHSPILEYAGHPENPRYEVELAVYDDHLVFLLGFTQIALVDRIIAWNWKDGTKAVKHAEHETLDGFLFLRKGTILVPSRDTGSIVIYNYELGSESGEFRAILCLTLPGLKSGLEYGYIKARTQTSGFGSSGATPSLHEDISGPSPSTDTQRRTDADDDLLLSNPTAHSVPFSPFVEDSIIAISVHITYSEEDSDDEERAYNVPDANGTLIVKKKTLFRWIQMCEEESRRMTNGKAPRFSQNIPGQRDGKGTTSRGASDLPNEQVHSNTESNRVQNQTLAPVGFVVPWSRWMQETRWLRDQVAPHWIRDVYGMRVAIRVENPETASATSDRYLPTDDTPNYASHPSIAVHYPVFSQLGTSRVVVYPRWGSEDEDPIEIMNRPQDPEPEPEEEVHEPVPPPQYSTRICDFNYGPYLRPSKVVPYPDHFGMDISIDYSQILEGAKSVESSPKPPTEAQAYARRNNRFVKEKKQKTGEKTTFDRGWSPIGRESGLEWTRRPVYEPTYIPANSTFAEPILTRLPYLEITSRFFNECTSLMMDGERVITMKTDDSNKLAKLEVLVI